MLRNRWRRMDDGGRWFSQKWLYVDCCWKNMAEIFLFRGISAVHFHSEFLKPEIRAFEPYHVLSLFHKIIKMIITLSNSHLKYELNRQIRYKNF